ncbi:MAG: YciI family protein, partial [Longimicrobiales bacterium]
MIETAGHAAATHTTEATMRYLILIYGDETNEPQGDEEMQKWFDYTEKLKASGSFLGGEALQPTS